LISSGCADRTDKAIQGWWSIDEIVYDGYDIRVCLLLNILTFEDRTCDLPLSIGCEGLEEQIRQGTWKTSKTESGPLVLDITSANRTFSGSYQVTFYKDDDNKLLKMELVSDSLYILCRKGFFDFNKNIEVVNELVRMTQKDD